MQERGRILVGEANRSSKLTDEQVRCIIRKVVLNGAAVRTTAKEIGCSRNAVKAIANKITWKHIWREFEDSNLVCWPEVQVKSPLPTLGLRE